MAREIDHRTIKLLIGGIAVFLGAATNFLERGLLESISAAYCSKGHARDVFVGCLFAIAAFMWAHNGKSKSEKVASKLAGIAALAVALIPTACPGLQVNIRGGHFLAASLMFSILAWFCYSFYRRALRKRPIEAKVRSIIYAICGVGILLSMAGIGLHLRGILLPSSATFVFHAEQAALILFGFSWLTASHVLPVINAPEERFKLEKPAEQQIETV